MRRRLLALLALTVAFALGLLASAEPVTDFATDRLHDLLVSWYRYRDSSGSTGTIYLMVAGYLLGQGLLLFTRQLWRGPLRSMRGSFAALDSGTDGLTGLPSSYALDVFLGRAIRWRSGEPSTRYVSVALFQLRGLEALNETRGALAGNRVLHAIASHVRDAAIPIDFTSQERLLTRLRLTPRSILRGRAQVPRCPARCGGGTFAVAMRGLDIRAAYLVARELTSYLDEHVRTLEADAGLQVVGGFAVCADGLRAGELTAGAAAAARAAASGGEVVATRRAGDGKSMLLDEFKELRIVDLASRPGASGAGAVAPQVEEERTLGADLVAAAKRWGPALACAIGAIVVLSVAGGGAEQVATPWSSTTASVPVVDFKGETRLVSLDRRNAPPVADATFGVEAAQLAQLAGFDGTFNPGNAQLWLKVTNRSSSSQPLSLFDFTAIDSDGQRLPVEPKTSLRFRPSLGSRSLAPGESWEGHVAFKRPGGAVTTVLVEPRGDSRLLLAFAPAGQPGP